MKLKWGTGMRDSNEFFHLIIYDSTGKLNYVRGSSHSPNLQFDIARGVISGTYFYAGTTFADFRLIGDSLINFSGVDVSGDGAWIYRQYYEIDDAGIRTIVRRDSAQDSGDGLYSR